MERSAHDLLPATRTGLRAGAVRAAIILVGLGGLLLVPVPIDIPALWFGAATDFLHVPIFAGLTYVLARYCFPQLQIAVVLFTACLTIGAEAAQPFFMRSASWRDAAYGLVGVGIAAAALTGSLPKHIRIFVILALAVWPVWQTAPLVVDAIQGWSAFPVLADFQSSLSTRRWFLRDARLRAAGDYGMLETHGNSTYGSGGVLIPIVRDWTDYNRLEFDFSFEGEPLVFLVSVRTGGKFAHEQSHYDLVESYPAGKHEIVIDLAKMKPMDNELPLELDRIQCLLLIALDEQPRTIKVGPIRLTKANQAG